MYNKLFSEPNEDQQYARIAESEDFTSEANRTKWYSFAEYIKKRKIDPALGRNTMLLLLRFLGLLTSDYRPKPGTLLFKHLMVIDQADGRSGKVEASPYFRLLITGEGLCEIKKAVALIRKKGGSI